MFVTTWSDKSQVAYEMALFFGLGEKCGMEFLGMAGTDASSPLADAGPLCKRRTREEHLPTALHG